MHDQLCQRWDGDARALGRSRITRNLHSDTKGILLNQTDWKEIFAPNDGMLLNIIAFDTKLNDWRHLFGLLSALYTFTYSEDDAEKELPDIELIFHRRQEASTCLRINAAGISINCHFFGEEPMDFDVLPEEVDSPEKAKAVFDFMTSWPSH